VEVKKNGDSDKENKGQKKVEVLETKENSTWWKPNDISYDDFKVEN
jgi:hypothetical protein